MSDELLLDVIKVKKFASLLKPELEEIENLDAYITIAIRKILNYCNIKKLPGELVEIAGEMVVDIINVGNANLGDEDAELGQVKSVAEGDTTVTFDYSSNENFRKELNKYFKNYRAHIAPFRRLRW